MLAALKQSILSPACISCGSFFCGRSLFCNTCYEHIIENRIVRAGNEKSIFECRHHYLFDWSRLSPGEIAQLVYRLKANNSMLALCYYADLLVPRLLKAKDNIKLSGIIPVPSSNPDSVHAHLLANQLGKKLNLPVMDLLCKTGAEEQKRLSAAERNRQRNICLKPHFHEEFTRPEKRNLRYLFADDVLTTGESFKQASAALSDHNRNLIATLFYRSRC